MNTNLPKQVPILPGHIFSDPYKQNFHKTQQFPYLDGSQQQRRQNVKQQIDENLLDSMTKSLNTTNFYKQREKPCNDFIPRIQPPWIKYERKVLRFYGYFQQQVVESRLENYRIRKIALYYYLSDDTIYITQPKIQNSGIPQGVFLKRQKVPKVVGQLSDCYNWQDIRVGNNINVFERIFRICNCDAFTREFYQYMEIPQGQAEQIPSDTFKHFITTKQAKINPPDTKQYKQYIEVKLGGGHPNGGLQKYISNDRKVLSFKLLWHDNKYQGGYNYFTLNYFLADDTVEVKQLRFENSGKDPFPLLLTRKKLPKVPINTYYPGMNEVKQQYYSPNDFEIGNPINIYGRNCIIYSCDDFTKTFYKKTLGKQMTPITVEKGKKEAVKHEIPPFNGYGTPEDSLGSVYSLQPKPPKKDMVKIFTNDQFTLRFEARMISESKDQNDRKFIISFFCGDQTIQVYQSADKNSGIWGGKFLQRKRHQKISENRYVQDIDFQIGGIVKFGPYTFQILKADDFTIEYMKQRPHKFPEVSLETTVNKLKQLASNHNSYDSFLIWFIKNVDSKSKGNLSYDQFYKNISRQIKLTNPEAYVLFKECRQNDTISMKKFFRLLGGS